ncbi:hypothetical protein B0H16DRAFT_1546064 [Mycena metata]|uniref:Protein kinase domain-containing protein n=1 Tax=Mycena metata TaxID=1033252 RepID=A0AAD7NAY4_9AGAR|nr:hypothetical protein B0H16DRAFT_1546064 [Mycena metata]
MENSTITSNGGNFFAGSQGFTINRCVFNNFGEITTPDIHRIPMGNIDLQRQIRSDELRFDDTVGVVRHERRRGCVRRVYSAKVEGCSSDMTAMVYDGDTAEQEWWRDVVKYTRMRHPNIFQIYGISSANGIHAALFHGDLIPYKYFLDLYKHSPVLTVYSIVFASTQLWGARQYFGFRVGTYPSEYTLWIRPPTGLLSVDFTATEESIDHEEPLTFGRTTLENPPFGFGALNLERMVIDWMTLTEYHQACESLCYHSARNWIPSSAPVTIGAVVSWPLGRHYEDPLRIACLDLEPDLRFEPPFFPHDLVKQ